MAPSRALPWPRWPCSGGSPPAPAAAGAGCRPEGQRSGLAIGQRRCRRQGMNENVASYCWRARGPLWKVYWLYGVLGSSVLSLILFSLMQRGALGTLWSQINLVVLAAYTVWIVVAVWRCAFNVEK